jgi:hypothetical protein
MRAPFTPYKYKICARGKQEVDNHIYKVVMLCNMLPCKVKGITLVELLQEFRVFRGDPVFFIS